VAAQGPGCPVGCHLTTRAVLWRCASLWAAAYLLLPLLIGGVFHGLCMKYDRFPGENHPCVIARYGLWSGSSIWTMVRTSVTLPFRTARMRSSISIGSS
jgi:hypothetical protein